MRVGQGERLAFIAGPCQMESRQHALETAHALKEIAERLDVGLIYKTSFDKANRTSAGARRGMGLSEALPIFAEIREATGLPVLTDVHEIDSARAAAEAVDVLQIPAFLCRQTDLLVAAARTGRAVNVKKGQFLAPWDMKNVVAKVDWRGQPPTSWPASAASRSATTPWSRTCAPCRSWPQIGCPVVFDATHSVQQPGGQGDQLRRPARVRAGAGARGGRGRRRGGVHGDPSRPGPCALGRPEHGAAAANSRRWRRSFWSSTPWPSGGA